MDTRNVVPAARTSSGSRWPCCVLGAGYIGSALAELALARGGAVVLADNWRDDRPRAARRARAPRGARRDGSTSATEDGARPPARRAAPDRVVLLAAQASRPISEREPGLHGADQPDRRAPRRRGGRGLAGARARLRQLDARLRRRAARRGRPGEPLRRAGRPRAHVQDLRRAGAGHARAPRRLRARARAAGDRLRPEPGRARGAGVADRDRQVPPARGRRRAS